MLNSEQEKVLYYILKGIKKINEKEKRLEIYFSKQHNKVNIYNKFAMYDKDNNNTKNIINNILNNIDSKYYMYDEDNIINMNNKKDKILYCREYGLDKCMMDIFFQDIVKIDAIVFFSINRRERSFYIFDKNRNIYDYNIDGLKSYYRFINNNRNNIISEMFKKELETGEPDYKINHKIYETLFD